MFSKTFSKARVDNLSNEIPVSSPSNNPFMINTSQTINNMPPNFNISSISSSTYQQILYAQIEIQRQQREFQEMIIKERYPVRMATMISFILIILSIIEIIMQILIIINKGPLYFIGWGIFIGVFGIFYAILVLYTCEYNNNYYFLNFLCMYI
jgi:hypothetical protein